MTLSGQKIVDERAIEDIRSQLQTALTLMSDERWVERKYAGRLDWHATRPYGRCDRAS
jgi:hypothetical protein